eukprot:7369098-Lingulodinium_polyedra.AAC.1
MVVWRVVDTGFGPPCVFVYKAESVRCHVFPTGPTFLVDTVSLYIPRPQRPNFTQVSAISGFSCP